MHKPSFALFLAVAGCGGGGTTGSVTATGAGGRTTAGSVSSSAGASSSSGGACGPAYSEAVLADSPIAYFQMDETSGTAMDNTGSAPVAGTYGSAVVLGQGGLVPSAAAKSPHFPGGTYAAADVAQVAQNSAIQAAAALSVEFAFEEDAANAGTVGDGYIDLVTDEWSVQLAPTNVLKLWLPTSGGDLQAMGTTAITPGVAHLVDATYDGTTAVVYLDGQVEATTTGSGTVDYDQLDGTGLNMAGSALAPTRASLEGRLAQVSVYAGALSAGRVSAHYQAGGFGAASCQKTGGSATSMSTSSATASGASSGTTTSGGTTSSSGGSSGGSTSSGGTSGPIDDYPRLFSILQSGSIQSSYDDTFQAWTSHFHLTVLGGNWEGWEQGAGRTKEQVITGIKSQSVVSGRVYQYVDLNEQPYPCGNAHNLSPCATSGNPTYQNKIDAMNWWVYDVGSSGTPAPSTFNSSWGVIDQTSAVAADPATGLRAYAWGAKYANTYFHEGCAGDPVWCPGESSSAVPSLDGFYLDNVFYQPRENGDWLRTGSTQSDTDPTMTLAFRTGEVTFFQEMAQIFPGSLEFGNSDDFADTGSTAPFQNAMGGAEYQSPTGYTFAVESWGGGAQMQQDYVRQYGLLAQPQYLLWAEQLNADGSDDMSSTTYQPMRNSLAACLMGNGYFEANGESGSEYWFDEFAVDQSGTATQDQSGVGYLGQPSSGAAGAWQTGAWLQGVWKREFANGIVLWNPKGNGAQTVSLAGLGTLKHLSGTQVSSINNGQTVTGQSVTLQDRDGLILLR